MAIFVRLVTITGRVQGVGYRAWLAEEASRRGLQGWVRNRRDGSVEALLAGDEQAVVATIAACRRGPPMARVAHLADEAAGDEMLALRGDAAFATLPTLW